MEFGARFLGFCRVLNIIFFHVAAVRTAVDAARDRRRPDRKADRKTRIGAQDGEAGGAGRTAA